MSILSSISFLNYESGIYMINLRSKCIHRVGVLINDPPSFQFPYKFELILYKNLGTPYKNIKALNC